jgi:hypothetical protein
MNRLETHQRRESPSFSAAFRMSSIEKAFNDLFSVSTVSRNVSIQHQTISALTRTLQKKAGHEARIKELYTDFQVLSGLADVRT